MEFHASLLMGFDFRSAMADGTIQQILSAPDSDREFLQAELRKMRIESSQERAG
jgi:hypothetical protein